MIPSYTLDQIVDRGMAYARTSFQSWPITFKSFIGRGVRMVALQVWGVQKGIEDIANDIAPRPQSSTDALTEWATDFGLSNGQGGYGPLLPTTASGGQANLTGVIGTVFPDGITATSPDGSTQIQLSGSVTIGGSGTGFGSVLGKFVAVTAGSIGNIPAGTELTWDNTPAGADDTVTLTSPLADGLDTESNVAVYTRIIQHLQTPPMGGVPEDYREWLAAVEGITASYIYGKRSGTGTVDCVITTGGSGVGRVPSSDQYDAAVAVLNAMQPLMIEKARPLLPSMPSGNGHVVQTIVTPATADFAYDWDDTTGSYVVGSYTPGTPALLALTGHAPASLASAIAAYVANTGLAPRLQVISTGSIVNAPVTVTALTNMGSYDQLTLGELDPTWIPPTNGDAVYAYGPVVATIAAAILALCDSLGPSRVSGYGDNLTPWRDTLTISGIIGVAEAAVDPNNNQLIQEVTVATIDGSGADVQGSDGPLGPEILWLSHVIVNQS